ncbi:MAG: class I SAM-dependent methyltransferase, partial [Actinobacteria bacterium]
MSLAAPRDPHEAPSVDEQPKARVREGYDRIATAYLAARPLAGADVALLADVRRALPPGAPVLDAGCGAGVPVTRNLAATGFRLTALDFSPVQLDLARSLGVEASFVQGDLAALPFADHSFAAVVSYYAVIHVPRAEHAAVFGEVYRVLRHTRSGTVVPRRRRPPRGPRPREL